LINENTIQIKTNPHVRRIMVGNDTTCFSRRKKPTEILLAYVWFHYKPLGLSSVIHFYCPGLIGFSLKNKINHNNSISEMKKEKKNNITS